MGNIAEAVEARNQIGRRFGTYLYWFRGHACADWKLIPSVHRDYTSEAERALAQRFRLAAPTRYDNVPRVEEEGYWFSLMQHYGLPTRLLDWTGSILTALFFVVSHDPKPGPGAVWVIAPGKLNQELMKNAGGIFLLDGNDVKPLLRGAFSGVSIDSVAAAYGSDVDMRMTIQQGAYTIHGDATPLESRSGAADFLMKIVIPEKAKCVLEEELWFLGIRRSTLFPDLGNLAKDLASDKRLHGRKP